MTTKEKIKELIRLKNNCEKADLEITNFAKLWGRHLQGGSDFIYETMEKDLKKELFEETVNDVMGEDK